MRRAAEVAHKSLIDFILDAAYQAAEQTLLDQRLFMVSGSQYQALLEMLDRPESIRRPILTAKGRSSPEAGGTAKDRSTIFFLDNRVGDESEIAKAKDLPLTWLAKQPGSDTVAFGDKWLRSLSAPLLLVPSTVVPEEYDVLINPSHPATGRIKSKVLRQFIYDPRL